MAPNPSPETRKSLDIRTIVSSIKARAAHGNSPESEVSSRNCSPSADRIAAVPWTKRCTVRPDGDAHAPAFLHSV
jgi:hypothetical protein